MSNIIQNYQLLLNEIPSTLKNLSYAIYPTDKTYNDVSVDKDFMNIGAL